MPRDMLRPPAEPHPAGTKCSNYQFPFAPILSLAKGGTLAVAWPDGANHCGDGIEGRGRQVDRGGQPGGGTERLETVAERLESP